MKTLLTNAVVSWKTSAFGTIAGVPQFFIAVPKLEAALASHDMTQIGIAVAGILAAVATILAGLCARDGDKSSEDHGIN